MGIFFIFFGRELSEVKISEGGRRKAVQSVFFGNFLLLTVLIHGTVSLYEIFVILYKFSETFFLNSRWGLRPLNLRTEVSPSDPQNKNN